MKLMCLVTTVLISGSFVASSPAAIISDTFPNTPPATGSNVVGTAPSGTNLPGDFYDAKGNHGYWSPGATLENYSGQATLRLHTDVGVAVDLDTGSYTSPAQLALSMRFNLGSITGSGSHRGMGLGVYVDDTTSANSHLGFYGLIVDKGGNVKVFTNNGDGGAADASTNISGFDDTLYHTLEYTLDRSTGAISGVLLNGSPVAGLAGTYAEFVSNSNFVGVFANSGSGSTDGYVDWLNVTAVPEPGLGGLLMFAGLLLGHRRRCA